MDSHQCYALFRHVLIVLVGSKRHIGEKIPYAHMLGTLFAAGVYKLFYSAQQFGKVFLF